MSEKTKPFREIGKDKFKKMFLDGFDPENMESTLEQFAKIEENIIKYIGNSDFKDRYKNAIINFGNWYTKKFNKQEIEDFFMLDYCLSMPLILILYFDFIEDNIYVEENEPWNKYILMFNDGYKGTPESFVSQVAYVNSYYSLREEREEEFWDENIEALTIFIKWLSNKHLTEKNEYAMFDNWAGEPPYIFDVVGDYINGEQEIGDLSDEQIDEMLGELDEAYKDLSYSEKKNIDILAEYVLSMEEDRSLFICPFETQPMEPILIPSAVNPENEEMKEEFKMIERTLKGYFSLLFRDNGVVILSHTDNPKTQTFNGFVLVNDEIHAMDAETLSQTIDFVVDTDVTIVYEVADLLFVN